MNQWYDSCCFFLLHRGTKFSLLDSRGPKHNKTLTSCNIAPMITWRAFCSLKETQFMALIKDWHGDTGLICNSTDHLCAGTTNSTWEQKQASEQWKLELYSLSSPAEQIWWFTNRLNAHMNSCIPSTWGQLYLTRRTHTQTHTHSIYSHTICPCSFSIFLITYF